MAAQTKSYFHRGSLDPLWGDTIPARFAHVVSRFPEREAVVSVPQQRRLSYAALKVAVDELARALLAMGFVPGDRIGIWAPNNIEWILLQMATARIGVVLVNINPAYRSRELGYALERAEVQGLFMIPGFRRSDYVGSLLELIPELKNEAPSERRLSDFPYLRRIVIYDPQNPDTTTCPFPGCHTWRGIHESGRSVTMDELDAVTASMDVDDPVNIQYTSGTTGSPKAVVLTHHNILNNARFAASEMRFTKLDRLAVPVPFYHCFGMVLSNLLCLSVGACVVIPCEHFDALQVLQSIEAEGCTAVHGVPTMFIAELEHPHFHEFDLSTLRTGIMAGAPCPSALMKRVMEQMHCQEILIGYGQTEASPLTHVTSRDDSMERRINTVGKNLPHQEVKIVAPESRRTVPFGAVGEVCFRGYHIMKGYYRDAKATREAVDENGWLASGDLGSMDRDGYVRITGRRKEMIIRGGENIYPREIEDVIFTHPKVMEVAVFGVPDDLYGEQVMAWVQLHPDQDAEEQEIRDYCREHLAHFKIPRYIWFVSEFPMTVTGKLQKFRMREIALQKMNPKA
jgi:fatty-acyl-CoA synthase